MTPEDQEQVRAIVAAVGQRINENLAAVEQRLEDKVAAAEQRLKEHATEIARDLQTEILRRLEAFAGATSRAFMPSKPSRAISPSA